MTVTLHAREFLLAGGRITFAEWQELAPEQQAALVEAGEMILQQQADMIVDTLGDMVTDFLERAKLEAVAEKAAQEVG